MPKEMDLIRLNAIKRYVKEVKQMRISNPSANELRIRFNSILKEIIAEATQSAKEDKRSTIVPRDVQPSIEQYLGKKQFTPEEVFQAVTRLTPIELGALVKQITGHIEKEKQVEQAGS